MHALSEAYQALQPRGAFIHETPNWVLLPSCLAFLRHSRAEENPTQAKSYRRLRTRGSDTDLGVQEPLRIEECEVGSWSDQYL